MNREFDNGFDEEEERLRSRSRKRDLGAGAGADSDTMPRGRTGGSGQEIRGAGQAGRAGSGGGSRQGTPVSAGRASVRTASDGRGSGSGARPRYAGVGDANVELKWEKTIIFQNQKMQEFHNARKRKKMLSRLP